MEQTLLLNWVYYYPVGHAVEALKVAKGYHSANRKMKVSVLLNAETPVELAEACPWITRAYAIDTHEVATRGLDAPSLRAVPAEWDYVVADERTVNSPDLFAPETKAFHKTAATYFHARRWKGARFEPPLEGAPRYRRDAKIRLRLPSHARRFTRRYRHAGPTFCILPAGSSDEPIYPPLRWWIRLIRALYEAFPDARVYVTGTSGNGRSATHRYPREALDPLFDACPDVVDGYDVGLWSQLALIQTADVFIAPHTGFAFLAPCLATPWLAISGARWPEYLFNETPFYCVLPDCPRYPCYFNMKKACVKRMQRGTPVLCMDPRQLNPKIPEILRGARLLLDDDFTYEQAVAVHRENVARAGVAQDRFFFFDNAIPTS